MWSTVTRRQSNPQQLSSTQMVSMIRRVVGGGSCRNLYSPTSSIFLSSSSTSRQNQQVTFFSTDVKEVEGGSFAGKGPIGADGKHEVWRENQSSDHDNEPRYVQVNQSRFRYGKYEYDTIRCLC